MKKILAWLGALALVFCFVSTASASPLVQEVKSAKGVSAWLVEDRKLPILSLAFAFRGGVEQDPADKQGLAALATMLLTQGAGDHDETSFQTLLSDHALKLEIHGGRDALVGSLKTLRETRQVGFALLRDALHTPRFDAESIERAKDRILSQQKVIQGDPEWQARRALFGRVFGQHPYAYLSLGTPESIKAITADDLRAFVKRSFARDNLVVAAAGAITPQELRTVLDQVFGDLPAKASLQTLARAPWPEEATFERVARPGTQAQILFAAPTLAREDAGYYAAEVANYILGGGGFASRLMKKLRDENGLTYGIRTGLATMDQASILIGEFATSTDKADEAWAMTQDVWAKLVAEGPTQAEVDAAKAYLTGAMPLGLTTTSAIASRLVAFQLDRLPKDYWDRYEGLVDAVSVDDVRAVLKRAFDPSRVSCAMVGG